MKQQIEKEYNNTKLKYILLLFYIEFHLYIAGKPYHPHTQKTITILTEVKKLCLVNKL